MYIRMSIQNVYTFMNFLIIFPYFIRFSNI
nr:MAG TPA: hypothetical protein [Caudoviricetes sp.]